MTLGFTQESNGVKTDFENKVLAGIKIHTFRADEKDRWKAGRVIHFVVGNRTKKRREFKLAECTHTQKVKIRGRKVTIDGKEFHDTEQLAHNDGFNSAEDFFKYFAGKFDGKIIHWTDKTYL